MPKSTGGEGRTSHQKEEYDHVPTPDWLMAHFDARPFHDLYPLHSEAPSLPTLPSSMIKCWGNPGYSRKMEALELGMDLHHQGYHVELLVPVETSTEFGKKLIQYGTEPMYFPWRPFLGCRNVELHILTGVPQNPKRQKYA
jgi:hypothetical protein